MDSHTVMFGVFGDPIRHSMSPLMMNRAFRETGLNAAYAAFHVTREGLRDAVNGIRALGFRGVNVTVPHKVNIMAYLDEVDESAKVIGAVNTIVNENGKLTGYNTDGIGYVRSLKEETGMELQGKKVLVLGAGGGARGVVYALAQERPEAIWIANRSPEKAAQLAADMQPYAACTALGLDEVVSIRERFDLVINTTPAGMYPQTDEMPVDPGFLTEETLVSDLVYNPLVTRFLRAAEKRGCRTHGGLGMLIYQGVYAFEYWTGIAAPVEAMRETVEAALAQKSR
jgi:shikimate dehydrogenase